MKKILYFANADWFFYSHRINLARAAIQNGFIVYLLAPDTGLSTKLKSENIIFINIPLDRSSTNPLSEFKTLLFTIKILRDIKPDIIHNISLKPIVFGTIAVLITKSAKVRINAITGLGYVFINKGVLNKCIQLFIFFVLKCADLGGFKTILQNSHDLELFRKKCIVRKKYSILIKGAGVDPNRFKYLKESFSKTIKVLLLSRMLYDKGVAEYIKAAKVLSKDYGNNVEFILAGPIDYSNKKAIKEETIETWVKEGYCRWIKSVNPSDVPRLISSVNIVVLPSYHEGLPKVLIEACASGRPSITSNVPGCNEIIKNNVNGLLVKPYDHLNLANKIKVLLDNHELRGLMGKNARKIFEQDYTIQHVIKSTILLYKNKWHIAI